MNPLNSRNSVNTEVKRFFREAQPLSSLPQEHWIVPGKWPAPPLKIYGDSQGENRKKLVDMANSLLITANRRAGDYSDVFYNFKPIKTRKRDSRTGRMTSRAMISIAVLKKEKGEKS